jgi:ParB-like chromosome segregation protein Spo0J
MADLRKNANWPADRVERWPVAKLVPNARNARTHSDEQIAQLAASIKEWGWTMPVLVDEVGGIIAGHGRVMAAHRLGIEDVPVMVCYGGRRLERREEASLHARRQQAYAERRVGSGKACDRDRGAARIRFRHR